QARLLERIGTLISSETALSQGMEGVVAASSQMAERWEKLRHDVLNRLDWEPVTQMIQEESRRLLDALPEGGVREGILAGLAQTEARLLERIGTLFSSEKVLSQGMEGVVAASDRTLSFLSQVVSRQGEELEKVLQGVQGLSGLRFDIDPKPMLASMLEEIRTLLRDHRESFTASLSSHLDVGKLETSVVRAIQEGGERLLTAQGEAFAQGFSEVLHRVERGASPEDVVDIMGRQLTAFRGEWRVEMEDLARDSVRAMTAVLESLGQEVRERHGVVDGLLGRLLAGQETLASRRDWEPVWAGLSGEIRERLAVHAEGFNAALDQKLAGIARTTMIAPALREAGEGLLSEYGMAMQRGFETILARIPSLAGIEEAVAAVTTLRSEWSGMMVAETQRLEVLAARAATAMESVMITAETQMSGIQSLGTEIRDLLERQGNWFKETIASKLESSGMAARLVSAFKEESEGLLLAQAVRWDEIRGALLADLEGRFSVAEVVAEVRAETARLSEDFRVGLAAVEGAVSAATVDPLLRAMEGQTAQLERQYRQEITPILDHLTHPVAQPVMDWNPVREMVSGEMHRLLSAQTEVLHGLLKDLEPVDTGLAPEVYGLLEEIRGGMISVSDLTAVAQQQTQHLDAAMEERIVPLPTVQKVLGAEVDRLAAVQEVLFAQAMSRIEESQGEGVDLQAVVGVIHEESQRLQEVFVHYRSLNSVADVIITQTDGVPLGHDEEGTPEPELELESEPELEPEPAPAPEPE
ncbi:MAG: hypothetical protein HQL07_10675, partial [Nitrospirae bacterium]|nr:hypothetical protein [Magnetococcales bacterium]